MATTARIYQMPASNGRPAYKASQVVFDDGYTVEFLGQMPAEQAIARATKLRELSPTQTATFRQSTGL